MIRMRAWVWVLFVALSASVAAALAFVRASSTGPALRPGSHHRNVFVPLSDQEKIRQRLFDLLRPVRITNCELERFGERNDGGYLLCGNLLGDVRSGYSYGISGYDGWGCEISRTLRVPVHQYDCFDTRQPPCAAGETVFHAECVGAARGTIEGRPFSTIEHQIAANGDAGKRIVLKIDVEGAEWEAFLQTPQAVLDRVDQMAVEFHGADDSRFVFAVERLRDTFHVAHLHMNNYSCRPGLHPFPAWAYEVLFVNKRIGETDGSFVSELPHPLDAPNHPTADDCQPARRR